MIVDKNNILESIDASIGIDIELGCGPNKKHLYAIGIDMLDYDCVDIVGDVFEVLAKIPNNSVNALYSYHFLEHIADIDKLIKEIHRVLSDNGILHVVVPHFSNPFYYSDLTHKVSFGLYSFAYYSTNKFKRKVPSYQNGILFNQEAIRLVFKSYPPRYIRHGFKRFFEYVFNINMYMKEFYEENLTYIFPCYEVAYTLSKKHSL
jgi:ubiquinone/menaquinone biosynthesis C-methylase UbiE